MNQTEPLRTVRSRLWEAKFPGCTDDFLEVFGSREPTVKQVSLWKQSWFEDTPNTFLIGNLRAADIFNANANVKERIHTLADQCGIHPYFYEFWTRMRNVVGQDINPYDPGVDAHITQVDPLISFYKEEHLVMFKLAW